MFKTFDSKAKDIPEFCIRGIKISPNDKVIFVKDANFPCLDRRIAALYRHLAVALTLIWNFSIAFFLGLLISPLEKNQSIKFLKLIFKLGLGR